MSGSPLTDAEERALAQDAEMMLRQAEAVRLAEEHRVAALRDRGWWRAHLGGGWVRTLHVEGPLQDLPPGVVYWRGPDERWRVGAAGGGPFIQCLVCGSVSYSLDDVAHAYCARCDVLHREVERELYATSSGVFLRERYDEATRSAWYRPKPREAHER